MTNIELFLTEEQLSDLSWLVNNYGHKLIESADFVNEEDVVKLAETLEAMIDLMA